MLFHYAAPRNELFQRDSSKHNSGPVSAGSGVCCSIRVFPGLATVCWPSEFGGC